jgi:cysteine desulfurase/selenocysteine lyase
MTSILSKENNKWKKLFPIFDKHPEIVYLDNAATTQKPKAVIQ